MQIKNYFESCYTEVSQDVRQQQELQAEIKRKAAAFAVKRIIELEQKFEEIMNIGRRIERAFCIHQISDEISKVTLDAAEYGVDLHVLTEAKRELRS